MDDIPYILYLFAGIVLLLFSGEYLVRGSVALARNFRVSRRVIGITVVSFGTSAPELVVSLDAAIMEHPAIAIGNVVGSNISNIALVLGLISLIVPVPVRSKSVWFDWPVMVFASLLFWVFIRGNSLEYWQGMVFVFLLTAYIWWSLYQSRRENENRNNGPVSGSRPLYLTLLIVILASAGLVLGASFLVRGASGIAGILGISEHAISVTVVAVGTSLPELTTSVVAAIRREMDISVGNIIGSNIFNLFGILGLTSLVKTIPVEQIVLDNDIYWMVGSCLLLFLFILPAGIARITRIKGIVFLAGYAAYVYFVLLSR